VQSWKFTVCIATASVPLATPQLTGNLLFRSDAMMWLLLQI